MDSPRGPLAILLGLVLLSLTASRANAEKNPLKDAFFGETHVHIAGGDVNGYNYKWELYNLAEDFSQNNDLAAKIPDKLRQMQQLLLVEAAYGTIAYGKTAYYGGTYYGAYQIGDPPAPRTGRAARAHVSVHS